VLVEAGSRVSEVTQQPGEEWGIRAVGDAEIRKKLDEVTVSVALSVPAAAADIGVGSGAVDTPYRGRTTARVDALDDRPSNPVAVW